MALLFEPITIRNTTLKNRIVVSPMCQYSSVDGFANDWHLVHLGSRAVGGAGLVFTEATAVSPEGRITLDDLGIWKDEHMPFLKRITDFIKQQNAVSGIQLAHAGRKASHLSPWKGRRFLNKNEGAWQTLAPSALPFKEGEPVPAEMTKEEIHQLINDFVSATKRGVEAGFEVFEIHAAHGYLINEFLSPISNHRNDEYGGSFENRIRLLMKIVKEMRNIIKEQPLFVRISATEWVEGGWDENDSVELAKILRENKVDVMDCSTGGNSPDQKIKVHPLYQVPFSQKIKKETDILTAAVGMITTTKEAEEILQEQKADLIIMARQLLREPYFPLHSAKELNVDLAWPSQYERAKQ
ncbi:MAG TPA: NADH:flavin oxidoreductase/NADH oxidase [Hanamia sp.]|jgi:2,4-dienoyl-CoA reductase-like NADH-dependent reductase (Old Yellow Enzyme family)|nr:NADH:flavin oxidoreductase/NADH oxidase [Hanamia sp.]